MMMESLSAQDALFCFLFANESFAEFRSKFGHLVLIFQELDQELRQATKYIRKAYAQKGQQFCGEIDLNEASFHDLINAFEELLDDSNDSLAFIKKLHDARKYRNRLAHRFTSFKSLRYHISFGGRAKTIQSLNLQIHRAIPLVMMVHRIGRMYAADLGLTDQTLDHLGEHYFNELGVQKSSVLEYIFGNPRESSRNNDEI